MMTLRRSFVAVLSIVLTATASSHVDHYVLDGPVSIDCPEGSSLSMDLSKLSIDRSNQLATFDSTFNGQTMHILTTLQNPAAGEELKFVKKVPASLAREEVIFHVTEIVSPSDKNIYINRIDFQSYSDDGSPFLAPEICKMNVHFRLVK